MSFKGELKRKGESMSKQIVHTDKAPAAVGPYVQGVKTGSLLFTSGQLGLKDGRLAEGIEAQAHAAMENLGEILKASGSDYAMVVKCTIFLQDLSDFGVVNKIYEGYFGDSFPARSCVQVAALPLGGLVEIECVAEVQA